MCSQSAPDQAIARKNVPEWSYFASNSFSLRFICSISACWLTMIVLISSLNTGSAHQDCAGVVRDPRPQELLVGHGALPADQKPERNQQYRAPGDDPGTRGKADHVDQHKTKNRQSHQFFL
jgi:hypothetical protein